MFLLTKTLLVDGNYLFKRSGSLPTKSYNPRGQDISALYSFMVSLRKYVKEFNINKVVVAWDCPSGHGGKLRYDIYPDYKANRKSKSWYNGIQLTDKEAFREEEEKSLLWQKKRVQQYIENLFIRQIESEFIEGDDLIAGYTQNNCNTEHIIIFTNDFDLTQLLTYKNVSVYLAGKNVLVNKDNFFINFKHDVQNVKLLKTLTGCSSDNIFGVAGLGESTLITHFPEIKRRRVELKEVIDKAKILNEERVKNKKKPLKVLDNIVNGVFNDLGEKGIEHYELNEKIIDLLNPMLTEEAIKDLDDIGTLPLDIEGRTSKNLLNMMHVDGFLINFPNSDFINFVDPFRSLIIREKEFSKKSL